MKNGTRILMAFDYAGSPVSTEEYEHLMLTDDAWHTEGCVLAALREAGYEVQVAAIREDPREIVESVEKVRPDLVWNLVEAVRGQRYYEGHVAAVLELLDVPYTGSGVEGLLLCKDKALSKKILKHHHVNVPRFVVSRRSRPIRKLTGELFPVFVKPLAGEGSEGIVRDSLAEDEEHALKRIAFLHERMRCDVIIEQFVTGREIYVGVLGNDRLRAFPPRELFFTKVPEGEPTYASYKAKWDNEYRKRWGIQSGFAEDLPDTMMRQLDKIAKRVYRVLCLRGYGRIDMRVTEDGRVFVVEANPNPDISDNEDLAIAAEKAGIGYGELVSRISRLALDTKLP